MSLPQCTCSPRCVSPASCRCVFAGTVHPVKVICGLCGQEETAYWPIGAGGRPWRALGIACPHCGHSHMVTFQGLPAKLQSAISTTTFEWNPAGAESKPCPANEPETFSLIGRHDKPN